MRFLVVIAAALLSQSCLGTGGLQELVKGLAEDKACIFVKTNVIYGVGNGHHSLLRCNSDGTTVTVTPDGAVSMKREAPKPPELDRALITAQELDRMNSLMRQVYEQLATMRETVKAQEPVPKPPPDVRARPTQPPTVHSPGFTPPWLEPVK
jgi:hypothetical protein